MSSILKFFENKPKVKPRSPLKRPIINFSNETKLDDSNFEKKNKSELKNEDNKDNKDNEVFTITFSESVENHVGMQQIGTRCFDGFTNKQIEELARQASESGFNTKIYDLIPLLPTFIPCEERDTLSAKVLVIRQGVRFFMELSSSSASSFVSSSSQTSITHLLNEIQNLRDRVDKKAFMYGRVVNKHARWNLCFADTSQEPDYEHKKGRIIAFSECPHLQQCRNEIIQKFLKTIVNEQHQLFAELNYYYNTTCTGIGWHGDTERRRVIGLRLGASDLMPLHFHWFYKNRPVGDDIEITLQNGDIYVMADKAVGSDWKRSSIPTLRHSTGASKFTHLE